MTQFFLKEALNEKIKESGLSLVELARLLGVSRPTIHSLAEGANNNPTLGTLADLAKVLKCNVVDFIGNQVIKTDIRPDILEISENVPWNSKLYSEVSKETCYSLAKTSYNLNLTDVLEIIVEIYRYCLLVKNGTFDRKFHDWTIQEKISSKTE